MEYMLLIHSELNRNAEALPAAARAPMLEAYRAYTEAILQSGVCKSSNRLRPGGTATSVRVREGKTEVHNGPYIETREELAWRSGEILAAVAAGDLAVNIGARFPLSRAAEAHTALSGRPTTGKVLLLP